MISFKNIQGFKTFCHAGAITAIQQTNMVRCVKCDCHWDLTEHDGCPAPSKREATKPCGSTAYTYVWMVAVMAGANQPVEDSEKQRLLKLISHEQGDDWKCDGDMEDIDA